MKPTSVVVVLLAAAAALCATACSVHDRARANPAARAEPSVYKDPEPDSIPDPAPEDDQAAASATPLPATPHPRSDHPTWPTDDELLNPPLKLKDCPVTITEWRASKGKLTAYTGRSQAGEDALSAVCSQAVAAYPKFLAKEHLAHARDPNVRFAESAALMPWDIDTDGQDPRNLNDLRYRFRDRTRFYNELGQNLSVQGYTDRNDDYFFMRHDILYPDGSVNPHAITIFAHELLHAMNDQYGVYERLGGASEERSAKDETLARKFTVFMGLGE